MTDARPTIELRAAGRSFRIEGTNADVVLFQAIGQHNGVYERRVTELYRRLLTPDCVAMDIGGHVGLLAIPMASLVPKGHVYAFEPVPESAAQLAANVATNVVENITVVACGISSTSGEMFVERIGWNASGSFLADDQSADGRRVPVRSIDHVAHGEGFARLDLVKIDVEGSELRVLAGGSRTLKRLRPALVVECNPLALAEHDGASAESLVAELRRLRPRIYWVGRGGSLKRLRNPDGVRHQLQRFGIGDLLACDRRPRRLTWASVAGALLELVDKCRRRSIEFVVEPGVAVSVDPPPSELTVSTEFTLDVTVENLGPSQLSSRHPSHGVNLSYRWFEGERVIIEGPRTPLPTELLAGQSAGMALVVTAPATPGHYDLRVTLVQEGYGWLSELNPRASRRFMVSIGVAPLIP